MNLNRAIITAAGKGQERIPLQTLIDRNGEPCSALSVQLAELAGTGIEEVGLVIGHDVDESLYRTAADKAALNVRFIRQSPDRRGFGHAILAAKELTKNDPFLLMVSDHIYVSNNPQQTCAAQLVATAREQDCLVSAVESTHESNLSQFGTIGGRLVAGHPGLFEVTIVKEKPTPTFAEQELLVPGQRVAFYLCFFGMHVITPLVMDTLSRHAEALEPGQALGLSPALNECVNLGKYLAVQLDGRRFDLEQRYGLLKAQIAIGLSGSHRDELLTEMVELLAPLRA